MRNIKDILNEDLTLKQEASLRNKIDKFAEQVSKTCKTDNDIQNAIRLYVKALGEKFNRYTIADIVNIAEKAVKDI